MSSPTIRPSLAQRFGLFGLRIGFDRVTKQVEFQFEFPKLLYIFFVFLFLFILLSLSLSFSFSSSLRLHSSSLFPFSSIYVFFSLFHRSISLFIFSALLLFSLTSLVSAGVVSFVLIGCRSGLFDCK